MRIRIRPLGVVAAAAVILTATACSTTAEAPPTAGASASVESTGTAAPAPQPTVPQSAELAEGEVSVFDLTPGMCSTLALVDEVSSPEAGVRVFPTVDCALPHDLEVYASHTMTAEAFPGADETRAIAEEQCLAAFEPYVGRAYPTSVLEFTWFAPNQQTWDQLGDREIFCLLQAGEEIPGSFQNSGL